RTMLNRLRSVVPDYPIQAYHGDYQHFTQNKAKVWGDECGDDHHVCTVGDYPGGDFNADPPSLVRTGVTTRLNRFIDHYARPPGDASAPQPPFNVTAELQICPQNANGQPTDEPGRQFTAPTFEQLAPNTMNLTFTGSQMTTSHAVPNAHATNSDPVGNFASNGGRCPVETQEAGTGVATYDSDLLDSNETMIGATQVTAHFQP